MSLAQILEGKVNFEGTDRASLVAARIIQGLPVKHGARRSAALVLGRFSSLPLNQALSRKIGEGQEKLLPSSFWGFLDEVISEAEHAGSLLTDGFGKAERRSVLLKPAEEAVWYLRNAVRHCRALSAELGKCADGRSQALTLSAALPQLQAKNVQSLMNIHGLTSDKLILCGPGCLRMLTQCAGLHRLWFPTGRPTQAMLDQAHVLLQGGRKQLRKGLRSVIKGWSVWPQLAAAAAASLASGDWSAMRVQFHFCELSKMTRRAYLIGQVCEEQVQAMDEEGEDGDRKKGRCGASARCGGQAPTRLPRDPAQLIQIQTSSRGLACCLT